MYLINGMDPSRLGRRSRETGNSTFGRNRWVIVLLAVLCALLSGACGSPSEEPAETPRPVRVTEVVFTDQPLLLHFSGEVIPEQTLQISFPVSGRIDNIWIQKESVIDEEQPLGQIDPTDYQIAVDAARAQLNAAHAQYDQALAGAAPEEIRQAEIRAEQTKAASLFARHQYERLEAVYEAGGISESERDAAALEAEAAMAAHEQAEQQLLRMIRGAREEEINALAAKKEAAGTELIHAENQLNRTTLRSSRPGTVAALYYEAGETYAAGTPFMTLRSEGAVVRIHLSREELTKVSLGDIVKVTLEDRVLEGVVTSVSESPDALTKTYGVDISLPQERYLTGTIARVVVATEHVSTVSIPMSAVLAGNPDYVFIVEKNIAQWAPVEILAVEGAMVWVSGLSPGQLLVTEGMHLIQQGDVVDMYMTGDQP